MARIIRRTEPRGTLLQAQQFIARFKDTGVKCPCCGVYIFRYWRAIYGRMARWLIVLCERYKNSPRWYSSNEINARLNDDYRSGDYGKLEYWRLTRSRGYKTGLWKPTKRGFRFVSGEIKVPKYALIILGDVDQFAGGLISIDDALATGFDRTEIHRGS